ncbi:MAG: hypothetical protein U0Q12_04005 [Vicinamibacterales bacterium]
MITMVRHCTWMPSCRAGLIALVLASSTAVVGGQDAPERDGRRASDTSPYGQLEFRFVGPPGNRVSAVAGVPGDSNVYYAGGASGGVWKSTDAGVHWRPIFDDQPAQSIGAIALAPSDPNVIWVGTGETFIRSNVSIGNGVYRSTDAGKTWAHVGLELSGRIGRIVVHPKNPDIAYAAVLGHAYGPQPERGVYRTTDAGRTWTRVLFVDENTGASDLAMHPENPNVLIAGMWQIDIKTWGRVSGGPGSGLFLSRDGGTTWTRLSGNGLPESPLGKIAVAFAPSDGERVYALIETGDRGSLWRSDNGGDRWRLVNTSRLLNERPHYYTRMLVMPDNANEVYFPSNGMGVTYDGGETADQLRWGGDNHDMWADPRNPSRIMIGGDGGVSITTVRGKEWTAIRLPIGQIYHVATDTRVPYSVYGHMQDYYSFRGPSNTLGGTSIHPAHWTSTAGCETGWNIPDPVDPDIVWGGCYAGVVERFDARTRQARSVSPWPERTMGANAGQVKLRMNWTFPIAISPHDHNTVYVGSQYVHRTSDGGETWQVMSPDLTLDDKTMHGDSGGLTIDNLSVEYAGVVFAIAESPREPGVVWAGTNDGLVHVTRDAGRTWTNVTRNLPGLPEKGTVNSLEPSRFDAGTCYVAIDLHQVNNRDPFIYKTTDYGRTWRSLAATVPRSVFSYAHVLREDPVRRGLLYLGTENALYVSFDDGAHWEALQNNLPSAPVYWLTVQEHFNDLVVGTYGRGIWILDDVTPLQQLTDAVKDKTAHLFAPRPAYRFRAVERRDLAPAGASAGRNPAYGASMAYWLKSARKGPVDVTIEDARGVTVRTLKGGAKAGLNRLTWDLRYEPTPEVEMRTTPPGNPGIWSEKRFVGKNTRPVLYYGIDVPKRGPLVAPGRYTVTLRVDGETLTQPLTVLKDPNSAGTDADVSSSTAFAVDVYKATITSVDLINQIEWSRKQIEDLGAALGRRPAGGSPRTSPDRPRADVLEAMAEMDGTLKAAEDKLLQETLADGDAKSFRGPLRLYLSLLWLQAEAGTGGGDVSGNSDFAPTGPQREVFEKLSRELAAVEAEVKALYDTAIPAFNRRLADAKLDGIVAVPPKRNPD